MLSKTGTRGKIDGHKPMVEISGHTRGRFHTAAFPIGKWQPELMNFVVLQTMASNRIAR
jgi:hypothetical protein